MMKKWGVRLIGILFLLQAISTTIAYANGISPSFSGYVEVDNVKLDITTPILICLFLYAGFQLARCKESGRIWALILLWPSVIASLLFFVEALVTYNSPIVAGKWKIGLEVFWLWGQEKTILDSPIRVFVVGLFMIFYLVPLYYLLRKDVKALFEPPTTSAITESASIG
ncbi:MAG: hypothetical protein ACOY0R_11935 [Chloroflexota bacterium]